MSGGGQGSVTRRYDRSDEPPSVAAVEAVASLEGVDPAELSDHLGTTLYDHVDPEALDSLVTESEEVRITFDLDGYQVRITESAVTVRPE